MGAYSRGSIEPTDTPSICTVHGNADHISCDRADPRSLPHSLVTAARTRDNRLPGTLQCQWRGIMRATLQARYWRCGFLPIGLFKPRPRMCKRVWAPDNCACWSSSSEAEKNLVKARDMGL